METLNYSLKSNFMPSEDSYWGKKTVIYINLFSHFYTQFHFKLYWFLPPLLGFLLLIQLSKRTNKQKNTLTRLSQRNKIIDQHILIVVVSTARSKWKFERVLYSRSYCDKENDIITWVAQTASYPVPINVKSNVDVTGARSVKGKVWSFLNQLKTQCSQNILFL